MKIETIESNVITDWVDVKFNGATHYEVYRSDTGWTVNECGYSGCNMPIPEIIHSKTTIKSKARAVAIALQCLATDILENDWAEEHHSEPYK